MSDEINILIARFLSGEAAPEEALRLEEWKNEQPANLHYYKQCEKIFFAGKSAPAFNASKALQNTRKNKTAKNSRRSSLRFVRLAAGIALIATLGIAVFFILQYNNKDHSFSYATSSAEQQVKLYDGSDVTIAPNSSITADASFGKKQRLLRLKGNAYFSVVHDEKIPFVIDAGEVFIKDIGTKFNIRNSPDSDTVFVHVDEGVVLLFDSVGSEITITANGNALYVRSSRKIISSAASEIKGSAGVMNFNATSLEEVARSLSEYYRLNIRIENPKAARCTITSSFSNEKLETVLTVICETTGLTYEKTADGYLIKGELCRH